MAAQPPTPIDSNPTPSNHPSLEHHEERSASAPHTDSRIQRWRFRRCQGERDWWLDAMPLVESSPRKVERFQQCGRNAWAQHSASRGAYRVRSDACRNRACPVCRAAAARDLAARIDWAVSITSRSRRPVRFLTLTVKSSSAPLRQQLAFLRKSFSRLRNRKFWRESVDFGYAVLEITRNTETRTWHPHIHIIMRSRWMDVRDISAAWRQITHGSYIVDIRLPGSSAAVTHYLTKYLAKPPELAVISDIDLTREWYEAMRNARLAIPFGKDVPPLPKVLDDGFPNDWTFVAPLGSLLERADRDDPDAVEIIARINAYDNENECPYLTGPP